MLTEIPGLSLRAHPGGTAPAELMAPIANAVYAANGIDERTTVAELENWLGHTTVGFDPHQDVVLAEVGGALVAYAWVDWVDTTDGLREFRLGGYVHPDRQGRGIGRRLLAWQEEHSLTHSAATATDRPRVFGTWSSDENVSKVRLFTRAGYEVARYFFEMNRPNLDDIDLPPMPDGLEIRPIAADRASQKQLWDADVEAFADHWGGFDASDAAFEAWLSDPMHAPDLWVAAWEGDEIAGAVTNAIFAAENEAFGRARGWMETVFVRRRWRRRGLGAALVARALVRLREAGMTEAGLGVDSDNPSGALALYQRAGFQVYRRSAAYRKPMEVLR
ncbi:MAG: GNAT family N-acetyltransferase [Chloroflexi bacterium]|nr:GNAT family N-acetyltransferase [Chloroflexota bacterium]